LDLKEVNFSYAESSARNFSGTFMRLFEPPPDILIRKIAIRLREKDQEVQTRQGNSGGVLYDEKEK
jgi:hypothetical protein